MVISVDGSSPLLGQGQNEDMSSFRACSMMFDCPRFGPVSFDAFHIRPIVKPSPFKDGLPIFD